MKKILFLLIILSAKYYSCDMCGAFMGLTPYDNNSQLSFIHRYRVFNGYVNYQQRSSFVIPGAYKTLHDPSLSGDSVITHYNYSSKDYEAFKVFELRGKYFLHERIEANLIFPFLQIKTKYDSEKSNISGFSDPSLFFAYHLIKRLNDDNFNQRLLLGAGVKLPVGAYNENNAAGRRSFIVTQPGTGSFDHFYYLNYVFSKAKFGANINSMIKFNGTNSYNEKFCNSFNQIVSLFYKISNDNFNFFGSILANYEYSQGIKIDKNLIRDTKVNVLLLGPSVDISFKQFTANCSYQFKAYERISSRSLSNAGRFVIGITYNFNQNKYLFK